MSLRAASCSSPDFIAVSKYISTIPVIAAPFSASVIGVFAASSITFFASSNFFSFRSDSRFVVFVSILFILILILHPNQYSRKYDLLGLIFIGGTKILGDFFYTL